MKNILKNFKLIVLLIVLLNSNNSNAMNNNGIINKVQNNYIQDNIQEKIVLPNFETLSRISDKDPKKDTLKLSEDLQKILSNHQQLPFDKISFNQEPIDLTLDDNDNVLINEKDKEKTETLEKEESKNNMEPEEEFDGSSAFHYFNDIFIIFNKKNSEEINKKKRKFDSIEKNEHNIINNKEITSYDNNHDNNFKKRKIKKINEIKNKTIIPITNNEEDTKSFFSLTTLTKTLAKTTLVSVVLGGLIYYLYPSCKNFYQNFNNTGKDRQLANLIDQNNNYNISSIITCYNNNSNIDNNIINNTINNTQIENIVTKCFDNTDFRKSLKNELLNKAVDKNLLKKPIENLTQQEQTSINSVLDKLINKLKNDFITNKKKELTTELHKRDSTEKEITNYITNPSYTKKLSNENFEKCINACGGKTEFNKEKLKCGSLNVICKSNLKQKATCFANNLKTNFEKNKLKTQIHDDINKMLNEKNLTKFDNLSQTQKDKINKQIQENVIKKVLENGVNKTQELFDKKNKK